MVRWKLVYSKQAQKDAKKLTAAGLSSKAQQILKIMEINPFDKTSPYEKLVGDLDGSYSKRINIQHRIVYQVYQKEKVVKIIRMWAHYE
jgi:toxin YoeB